MQDEIDRLRMELQAAREKAKGKHFMTHPDLFKTIEAIKVKIAHILPKDKNHG